MNKEKQIEKMAKVIASVPPIEFPIGSRMQGRHIYTLTKIAEALYNAGYRKLPDNIGDFSDGYHTFNELYHHRAVLFSVICNMMPEKAWKSKLHNTGDMFNGMFIVGIETEQGQATYHYDIDPYWDMFKVKELEKAPKWDGHTPTDAIQRIGNIKDYRKQSDGEWVEKAKCGVSIKGYMVCSVCDVMIPACDADGDYYCLSRLDYCPRCGAKMKGGDQL